MSRPNIDPANATATLIVISLFLFGLLFGIKSCQRNDSRVELDESNARWTKTMEEMQ